MHRYLASLLVSPSISFFPRLLALLLCLSLGTQSWAQVPSKADAGSQKSQTKADSKADPQADPQADSKGDSKGQDAAPAPEGELEAERIWLTEQRDAAIKDLAALDEKEVDKKKVLQGVRDQCEDGLSLIERYRLISQKNIEKPYSNPDLTPLERKDLSLPPELLRDFADMDSPQRDELESALKKHQEAIERETQLLDDRQGRLVAALGAKKGELSEVQGRTESRIKKDEDEAEEDLAGVVKRLDATPKPEGDLFRSLETHKRVMEARIEVLRRERRVRKEWIDWLDDARNQLQKALDGQQKGIREEYSQWARAVDERLSQLKVYQLPEIDLKPITGVETEESQRVGKVLLEQRGRIEQAIREAVQTHKLRRRVHLELLDVQSEGKKTAALIQDLLERTSRDANESRSIRSFRLQMAIKALERESDRSILKNITWQKMRTNGRLLANQLEALHLQTEDIRDRVHRGLGTDLVRKIRGALPDVEKLLADWSAREEKESRFLLNTTEVALTDLLSLQGALELRRKALRAAIGVLESRGLLLQDPQRLTLRGQGLGSFFSELGFVVRRLWTLPLDLYHAAVDDDAGVGGRGWRVYIALLLILASFGLSIWLQRRAGRMQRGILAASEPARNEVLRLTVLAWIGRMLPWISLGLAVHFASHLFAPGSQDARLCLATGKFFLYASFWIVTSRVLLRPAKPKLRFFIIQDQHARRLYRIVNLGLVFWLLSLMGEMMGALLSGGQGRNFQAALQALGDGGLLWMAVLFFRRKAFLQDLFPGPDEGGLRFLQAFVMTVLWPLRIALVLSLVAWVLTYYDLAHRLGVWIMGGFASLLIAVAFHQILRNEINDRFFLRRYRVDEETLEALSDEERESLISDRGKVAKLTASYLEILEFLLAALLYLVMVSWFNGLDGSAIQGVLDTGLWGSFEAKSLVTLGDLLMFILTVFLTLTLSKRSGPTVDYFLEKRTEIDRGMRYTMGTLSGYLVFIVGMGLASSQLHIGFAQVSWILAALGVGIGFGLQDIVSNFFSGLILLFERPLRVGDIVHVGDTLGEVKKITIRSTTVTSFDNIDVIVPNKDFISSSITNWTASDRDMRSTIDVGVAYGSDLKRVRQVLVETVCKHGRVFKKPAPNVFIKSFGDSSIDFAVVYWTLLDYKRGTFSDLHFAIEAAFGREGIEIPFPQRDVNLRVADEIPVVIRGKEKGASEDPETESDDVDPPASRSKDKRDDDREIRRISSKTEASDEVEAGNEGGVDSGGEGDL